jgi:Ni/Fe-hydrogenase subunit HybB-like protein
VLGIVGWRWNFVVPPLALPKIEGLAEAFVSARLTVSYVPNLGEWLSYVGLFSLWFLLFSVGKALLPIEEAADGPVSQPTKSGVQVWGEAEEIS